MTFETYLKGKGVELRPWQREAARAFLKRVYFHQSGATGKSALMHHLSEFLSEHGNNFHLDADLPPLGAKVSIIEGPFLCFAGTVVEQLPDLGMVRVEVDVFGKLILSVFLPKQIKVESDYA